MKRYTRSLFDAVVADGQRLKFITGVLSKHGLSAVGAYLGLGFNEPTSHDSEEIEDLRRDSSQLAVRLRKALEDLGPTFIKLGQILSTRPDIVPPVYIHEFEKLQDNAPTIPFEQVRQICEREFGRPISSIFSGFEPEPLATASMAQVHRAVLDGIDVVVKVQRPGIEKQIISDLALLHYAAKFAEATIEEAWLASPVGIVQEFERAIVQELNFLLEAKNTIRAKELLHNDESIIIPTIIEDYTTDRVITQTFVYGHKINTLQVGSQRAERLARRAMDAAFRQVFEAGFFHGDPHPGNILITDDDKIAFLDWGLVGHLSSNQQSLLIDLLVSFSLDDLDSTARLLLRMGWPEKRVNLRRFRHDIATIRDTFLRHDLAHADLSAILSKSMEVAHSHCILINPEYALLAKAFGTVDGVLRSVYPTLDIVETVRPFATRLLQERYSKEALTQAAVSGLFNANHLIKELPLQLDQLMTDVEEGRLQVRVHNPGMDRLDDAAKILGSRILLGMTSGALILSSTGLFIVWNPSIKGHHLIPLLFILTLMLAIFLLQLAVGWHFFIGGMKRLKIRPWIRLLFRQNGKK